MQNFIERFLQAASEHPRKTALVCKEKSMTYAELETLSAKIASRLIRHGAVRNKIYPIVSERSCIYIASIIGVLRAGAAYSPLSVEYPKDRIAYIISDSKAELIIDKAFLEDIENERILSELPQIDMDNAAAVIYTSGSTGNPKGVLLPFESIEQSVDRFSAYSELPRDCRTAVNSPLTFVASTQFIFTPLCSGGTVYITPTEVMRDPVLLADFIEKNQINLTFISPKILRVFKPKGDSLKIVHSGGERVSGVFSDKFHLIVGYGQTESAAAVLMFDVDKKYDNTPIGKPLSGVTAYILDENGNKADEGELCLAGAFARCYLNSDEISARTFISNPFFENDGCKKLLRTGDIVRRGDDGNIIYMNRKDWMVKINGQRVEIGEVEVQLGKISGVAAAAVKAFTDSDGQTYLCGYFTAEKTLSDSDLRRALLGKLPSYMVPRFLVQIDEFPLTPNGKLDRQALREPDASDFRTEYAAPETDEERAVCAAFESILGIDKVGINDDFFALGGDSIKVVMLQERLSELRLSSAQIFSLRTPREIAKASGNGGDISFEFEEKTAYPMTDAQLGIYLAGIQDPQSLEYNNPASMFFPVDMNIDADRLADAVKKTAELYPFMKVCVKAVDGVPSVLPVKDMPVEVSFEKTQETDPEVLSRQFVRPFDLENGPLFRFKLFNTPAGIYYFSDVHHLITDGTSISLFTKNLVRIYSGEMPVSEDVSGFMLCDYEQKAKQGSHYRECREFFDNMLSGVEVDSNIIPDEIPEKPSSAGRQMTVSLSDYLPCNEIAGICKKLKITENSLFLGAFSYSLAKQSGQEQALFCTVENGRHNPGVSNTYGMLVKTLPLCVSIDENEETGKYLSRVQELLFGCLSHDQVSIVTLANEYEVSSDILFVYQGEMLNGVDFGSSFIPFRAHKTGDAMSKLSLDVLKRPDDYTLSFEYRADLYLDETIENFIHLYINIIKGLLECEKLCDITFCTDREKSFYRRANDNAVEFDRSLTVVGLFREQVRLHPDKTAIVFRDKTLTYSQLDDYSERLARLLASEGITREVPVGIMVKRCELFPVCTFAVLKAGGGCQPLDSNYPPERLLYMLEDSGAPVVIADDDLAPIIEGYKGKIISANTIFDLPEDNNTVLTPPEADSLFALIYTSGSTGKPKGCMLEHRNLVNYCLAFHNVYGTTSEDRFSAYGAFGFDASMQDFYPALTSGATVYIVPEEMRLDLVGLHEFVTENQITMMDCTTQLGRQFITAYPDCPSMKAFTVGGEKLVPPEPPRFPLHNTYGPTECTIMVTDYEIDRHYVSVPIGKSFGNCDIYIIDKQNRLLPPGAVGELVISGYPVTRGYLNRPDLTDEKFIRNPFFDIEGYERMYLTGDVCRYLSDGNLQFVGRRDEQVKIRGFRIELTEIERRIRTYECISDACVIAKDLPTGGKAIVAYIVSDSAVDIPALNDFIADELPKYMVPSVTMQIEKIPITPNGKVDKRKLPEPAVKTEETAGSKELNELEKRLCAMVGEITGFEISNISESLVSSGLTSLTTIMFSAKLYEAFGLKAKVAELMDEECSLLKVENMIIENLLSGKQSKESESSPVSTDNVPLCAEQLGVYYDSVKRPEALIYNIPVKYTLSRRTDTTKLKAALEKLIETNPVLTSCIVLEGKELVQKQTDNPKPDIPVLNIKEERLHDEEAAFVRPFNLAHGPLFRAEIIKTESDVILLADAHHIVFDGLSLSAFIKRLADIYTNGTEPGRDVTYYEYIAKQAELENSEMGKSAAAYYQSLFKDYENASDISADLSGNEEDGELGEAFAYVDAKAVEEFCRKNKLTPAALFLAATEYTVSRCTADRNVYMSMISGGRENVRFIDSFGMFVKTLPIYAKIDTERTALQFVRDAASDMREAQANSAYPFIKLLDKYSYTPKINYACQLGIDEKVTLEGEPVTDSSIAELLPKFHLNIHIEEGGDKGIAVNVQYNTALYSPKLAQLISDSIAEGAKSVIADAEQKICKVSMLTDRDKKRLEAFSAGEKAEIPIQFYHRLFEAQVKKNPDKTALIACDHTYTFDELDRLANRLANALIAKGVSRGDRIAMLLPRTSRQIISIYGILKTGSAYIPCDPEYPDDRIQYIIENSGAKYIITDRPRGFENEVNVEELLLCENDTSPDVKMEPTDTAYMIYTSGSTGRPKGVIIPHKNIANHLTPHPANVNINAIYTDAHAFVSVTTVSFDMSLKETAGSLCNGVTLVLANEDETKDPLLLCDLMERTGGDAINATCSRMEQYMMLSRFREALSRCRVIMCGGEKYSPKLLENLKKTTKARIFNTYGPTETTVSCNSKELTNASAVSAGRPLLNAVEYIVDADENILPAGVVGELYIGGAGVGDGYSNNPELTARSFITFKGERFYRSGDYARFTDDGDVVILGRTDNQVKLRGLRIELGEIERAMLSCEGVRQAVALIRPINGMDNLCAYYSADSSVSEELLRDFISRRLTAYMVPAAIMRLDAMPQTPNGKTDIRALPQPELNSADTYTAPSTREESIFCDIFAHILKLDKVSVDSSFFDLGGTSLTVTSVLVEANDAGFEVSYGDIFTLKTPRALAAKVSGKDTFSDGLADYDYKSIDALVAENTLDSLKENKNRLGNILLTGATGFLGIHILRYLLDNYSGHIYCLLRGSKSHSARQRLVTQLFYYFESTYSSCFKNRITVIEGSVTSTDWFAELENERIDTVINCAALVKHFSETNDLMEVNAEGVKKLIGFCKAHGSMLVQVSTGSVAGDRVNNYPPADSIFNEQTLYFGQTIDNQYVYSKFIAERYALEAMNEGLKVKIMRVGTLAPRSSDGEFQINFDTNGFMGRLRAYVAIGAFPYSMMEFPVRLAPIDDTAEAIVRLCTTPDKCCIFHPLNNHVVPLGDIIMQMQENGLPVRLVEDDEFAAMLSAAENDPEKAALLTTLLAYENKDSSRSVEMIKTDNNYTTQVLYRLGFRWSMTPRSYMNSFLQALDGLRFFDIKEGL